MQGEFNDAYDKATSCTPCFTLFDKEYAVGITTAGSGTASSSGCRGELSSDCSYELALTPQRPSVPGAHVT